jgi:hypothetical protein
MIKEDSSKKYDSLKIQINDVLTYIENIIVDGEKLEGNCFYLNKSFIRNESLIQKQYNLYYLGCKSYNNICEIGFNAGHSAFLLLLGNTSENITFTIFDINHHEYTNKCYDYIKNKFKNVEFEFIEGDSVKTIPDFLEKNKSYEIFDLIHVDGGHDINIIKNDFANSIKLLKKNGIIIIDDVQKAHINDYVNTYISTGIFEEINNLFETTVYPHRILKKLI